MTTSGPDFVTSNSTARRNLRAAYARLKRVCHSASMRDDDREACLEALFDAQRASRDAAETRREDVRPYFVALANCA